MRIRIVGQAGQATFPFGTNGPWVKFKNTLINRKDVIVTQKFGQEIYVLICHGYSKNAVSEAKKSKIPKNRMILVLWEPPIIHPKLHSDKYLSNFGHIYAPSKQWAKNHNAIYFKWPVGKIKNNHKIKNFNSRRKNAVIIQGNKVNFFKGENYSLRRAVLFESLRFNRPIILYGNGWNKLPIKETVKASINFLFNIKLRVSQNGLKYIKSRYPYFGGISNNKFKTLEEYKISIVIENHNSYISEKIFDALNSGCVTIYVGAKLEEYGLNKKTAIQLDSNLDIILDTLEKIMKYTDKDILKLHTIQRKYIKREFGKWNNDLVLKNLAKDIRSKIK